MTFHEGFGSDTDSDEVESDILRSTPAGLNWDASPAAWDNPASFDTLSVRYQDIAKPGEVLCHDCQSTPAEGDNVRCIMCARRYRRRRAA